MKRQILKVLVGSRAHKLHTDQSDYDWRGVFVTPTIEILKLGGTKDQTSWIEGKEDDTSWEIGKFLFMAMKCNPTVLEVFKASAHFNDEIDRENFNQWGKYLQDLFPYVWSSKDVKNAFVGYGLNQRKKFLENKDVRPQKYAVAYLRILYMACQLLETGTFEIDTTYWPIHNILRSWKNKDYSVGDVIQTCVDWEKKVELAYKNNPDKQANIEPVNEFLLEVRKEFWV